MLISLGYVSGVEFLDHTVGVCLTFTATARKFPSVTVPCNIPTSSVKALPWFFYIYLIEVWLIYNIILVSGAQLSDQYFCRLYSIISYYKIMAIIPCAIQYILVAYLFYT